jgi:hypothetical protein
MMLSKPAFSHPFIIRTGGATGAITDLVCSATGTGLLGVKPETACLPIEESKLSPTIKQTRTSRSF